MNSAAAVYWQSPAAVRVGMASGAEGLIMFATRLEAEQFVHMLPALQVLGYEKAQGVAWAMLVPCGVGLN